MIDINWDDWDESEFDERINFVGKSRIDGCPIISMPLYLWKDSIFKKLLEVKDSWGDSPRLEKIVVLEDHFPLLNGLKYNKLDPSNDIIIKINCNMIFFKSKYKFLNLKI